MRGMIVKKVDRERIGERLYLSQNNPVSWAKAYRQDVLCLLREQKKVAEKIKRRRDD
jgi:hypothetical protein